MVNSKWVGGIGVHFPENGTRNMSGHLTTGTNQLAELYAAVIGILKCISVNHNEPITLYSDSMYMIKCATVWGNTWKKNGWVRGKDGKIENLNIIKILYYLNQKYKINFIHVRSHRKEPLKTDKHWKIWHGNFMADKLANDGFNKTICGNS
jgi:ribonuclease HI